MRYPPPKGDRRSAKGILSHPTLEPIVAYLPTRLWTTLTRLIQLFEANAERRAREAEERVRAYVNAEAERIAGAGRLCVTMEEAPYEMRRVLTLEWRPHTLSLRMLQDHRLELTLRPELRLQHTRMVVDEMARRMAEAVYKDLASGLDPQHAAQPRNSRSFPRYA